MDAEEFEEKLEHWGVKGMHWGIRNARSQRAIARRERKEAKEEFKTVKKLRKKRVSQLSSQELELVNKRLNLEKNFAKLNPGKVERGHNAVKGMLALTTTAGTVYALPKTPLGRAILSKMLKKKGGVIVSSGARVVKEGIIS